MLVISFFNKKQMKMKDLIAKKNNLTYSDLFLGLGNRTRENGIFSDGLQECITKQRVLPFFKKFRLWELKI
jgi:hypothetical protein